jgi:hypothetical protein
MLYNNGDSMFYLFAINTLSDVWDEVPYEKREWWLLIKANDNKQELLAWHNKNKSKSNYSYKIVTTSRSIKDCFYPRKEIKTRSQTAQMLKAINYAN